MLEVRTEGDIRILKVICEVTHNNIKGLESEIEENLSDEVKKYIINLGSCTYINSEGFSYIIEFYRRLKREGRKLVITDMVQDVRRLFEVTKMDSIIETYKNEKEALDRLKE